MSGRPIKHPTYGTLAELAAELEATLASGECVRMGQVGALAWFVRAYQEAEPTASATLDQPWKRIMREKHRRFLG